MPNLPPIQGAREVVASIAAGRLTAEAAARAIVERVAELEPRIGAWHRFEPERLLEEARRLDRGPIMGSLHGLPVGIKDVIDTADFATGYGSALYEGGRPAADAICVALLRHAGGLVAGMVAGCVRRHARASPPTPRSTPPATTAPCRWPAGRGDSGRWLSSRSTLAAAGEAPHGLGSTGNPVFNRGWTQLRLPCITVGAGSGTAGLPLGLQLVGKARDDERLFEVAMMAEAALRDEAADGLLFQ